MLNDGAGRIALGQIPWLDGYDPHEDFATNALDQAG